VVDQEVLGFEELPGLAGGMAVDDGVGGDGDGRGGGGCCGREVVGDGVDGG
jgi:hypothetical protein